MLVCGALTIIDMATGTEVRQSMRTHCRIPPPTKVVVRLIEENFHTLLPSKPLTLSTPFTRRRENTGGKPLPKHHPDYATEHSANAGACGVDGLEPGHVYELSLASQRRIWWDIIRWWEYGTKEQVLQADENGAGLDGRKVRFGRGPHEKIVIDGAGIGVIRFECRE